jgi:hypothetical protein
VRTAVDLDQLAKPLTAFAQLEHPPRPTCLWPPQPYGSLAWAGAERAIDQFFADKPKCVIYMPDSSGSAVIRRQRPPGAGPTWIGKRQFLALNEWHSAANGQLSSVLTDGWSSPEGWGAWGVGSSHQIQIMVDASANQPLTLDLGVHAFIWDEIEGRKFDVVVNGQQTLQVTFTAAQNSRTVSLENLRPAGNSRLLSVEIRPQKIAAPKDVKPSSKDTRTLGIALHRIRIR